MVTDTDTKKIIESPRGGEGSMTLREILAPDRMHGHVSLFARIELQPRSSIGVHRHVDETEAYYILSGSGFFLDNDGSRIPVKAGDICTIDVGGQHGIENPTDDPLEFIAIVYPA